MRRFLAVLHARNLEFFRDRASLGWNFIFPMLMVIGFSIIFSNGDRDRFKVGIVGEGDMGELRYIQHIPFAISEREKAIIKVPNQREGI